MLINQLVTPFVMLTIVFSAAGEQCTPFDYNNIALSDKAFKIIDDTIGNWLNVLNEANAAEIESIYADYISAKDDEDKDLNITQLVNKYGYPMEEHEVETSDGYLLGLFRIPNNGPTVFVMHGVLSSSDDFFTVGSSSGLGYLLADAGYDVWLGNARGNNHSRRHVSKSPDCGEFWDFSFDEIGRYDLPAMIDYVLNVTKEEQLVYIGHSQGSTAFFVLCSELPEYNDKVKFMVALSAVAFMPPTIPLLDAFSSLNPFQSEFVQAIGMYEFCPRNSITQYITDTYCGTPALATVVCGNILNFVCGLDLAQINGTAMPAIFGHYPAGVASKQLLHYVQLIESTRFARYDYGPMNEAKYGVNYVPDYPVEKITTPIVIFYSPSDDITPSKSVLELSTRLGKRPEIIEVTDYKFTHSDFLFAKNVKSLVYDKILSKIEDYLNEKEPVYEVIMI